MKSVTPLCLVAVMIMLSAAVTASPGTISKVEDSEKGPLMASCEVLKEDPSSKRAHFCRYYIYGLIDAGQVVDETNTEKLAGLDKQRSSFTERAYRTRVGPLDERVKVKEPLLTAFCIPQNESKEQVIIRLLKHLPYLIDSEKMLSIAVYRGLETEYPCG